jgi:type IV pilus assembly protein PilY1
MFTSFKRIGGALVGLALGFASAVPALADDTEIYVNATTPSPEVRPNILFIVDTSGSMKEEDSIEPRELYNSTKTYTATGNCTAERIFFRRGGEPIPNCDSNNYILKATSTNKCAAMLAAIDGLSGTWTGKAAQYNDVTQSWRDLSAAGTAPPIECQADRGVDGDGAGGATWAHNGDKDNKWSTSAAAEIDWNQNTTYTFYSANWMNWHSIPAGSVPTRRIDAVKQAVISMTSSIDGVNLGLMRYSNNGGSDEQRASGGYVVQAVDNVTTNRAAIVKAASEFTADGFTPLSETLYEAYLYYAGKPVLFGNSSVPGKSVDGARKTAGGDYKSPIIGECQKSYIIYLTDGLPTSDNEADDLISTLDHGAPGACTIDTDKDVNQQAGDDGICLDDMAHYLKNHDLNSTLNDDQTVTTYTIGFGGEVKGQKFLTKVATAGGGERFDAQNSDQLTQVLTKITEDVLNTSTTFSTASVGVNAFNRAQTRDDLYFAMFSPKENLRWDGNLKKYKLAVDGSTPPQLIVTGQGSATDAIDQTKGVFKDTTQSFWSPSVDGNDATAGGAASKLPGTRKIYTYLGNNPKGTGATLVALNTATADDFGAGTTADERTATLAFAYGTDTKRMGDPLHSTPQVVTYNKTTDIVYVATNDGYLHAVDAATGIEQWAFVPKELLPRLKQLLANPAVTNRTYGLDGDITVLRFDKDNDGVIDATDDRVWLYVGMRRGGHSYYAVDVTNPSTPTLLWVDDDTVLPGLGETWSAPVVTRVDVKGASQNSQKLVLIFGGGYDSAQEGNLQVDDATGNRIFMVDAKTGDLLWYGTRTDDTAGTSAQQGLRTEFAKMTNSFPARLTVIDTNGDLFADRIYAGDMGGRVWRFDIFNNNAPGSLVTGGVFAELGQGQVVSPATPKIEDTRRFYNAPDVALVQRRGADPYYNIAIGSGYRGHPLKTETVDRFYSLRDKQPFTKFSQSQYDDLDPLTDGSLVDITSDPQGSTVTADSNGWKYVFKDRKGEKVLAESTTASDVILVPTYQPDTSQQAVSCRPHSNSRVYAFRVDDGSPVLDLNKDKEITNADISTAVMHEGILGNVNVGLLRGDLANQLDPNAPGAQTVCLAGMHILGQCVQVNDSVRTYWRKDYDGTGP